MKARATNPKSKNIDCHSLNQNVMSSSPRKHMAEIQKGLNTRHLNGLIYPKVVGFGTSVNSESVNITDPLFNRSSTVGF